MHGIFEHTPEYANGMTVIHLIFYSDAQRAKHLQELSVFSSTLASHHELHFREKKTKHFECRGARERERRETGH